MSENSDATFLLLPLTISLAFELMQFVLCKALQAQCHWCWLFMRDYGGGIYLLQQ